MKMLNYQKKFRIADHGQVVVVGAGLGGIAAAIASARNGADTLLIERNGFPGGVVTAGHCCSMFNCFFNADGSQAIGGIPFEIASELANKAGPGESWKHHRGHLIFDLEKAKTVLTDLLTEAGVRLKFFTVLSDVIVEDGKIVSLLVTGRNGQEAIEGEVFVDATGDSDLAVLAGCDYRTVSGKASYLFRLGNVDLDKTVDYFRQNPDQYIPYVDVDWDLQDALRQYEETGTFLFPHGGGAVMDIFKTAIREGRFKKEIGSQTKLDALQMHGIRKTGTVHIITGFTPVSSLETERLTDQTSEGRKIAFYVADFLKHNFPGMERSYVVSTADDLGIRLSRVIRNDCPLTKEMQTGNFPCKKSIGKCLVIHWKKSRAEDSLGAQSPGKTCFDIPLESVLPSGVDNLIMGAGRSIHAETYGIVRIMGNTMVVGQGAGTVASVAALTGRTVRTVDFEPIRKLLAPDF